MIQKYLKEKTQLIEKKLDNYLAPYSPSARLSEAMRYGVMNGGKRIRPILVLAVSEVLGGNQSQVLPLACAIEMIHSYSLIHDDLPAMDNDNLRRGKPTTHKKFDEATAILAGDTLQAYAFEVIARESPSAAEVSLALARAIGANGMAGGQMLDLQAENKKTSLKNLRLMHRLKTGALIKLAITAPMLIFIADQMTNKSLNAYAEAVGLAFQIKDDILDLEGHSKTLGKTPGKDCKSKKSTYVTLLGLTKAKKILVRETEKAYAAARAIDSGSRLLEIAQYLLERKN